MAEPVTRLKAIAIIPARGGSKRIPKKNIRPFLGKPIIAYSIEGAIKSGCFDEVMVSTDSEEIKKVALKHRAKVPFMRSKKNASDMAPISAAVLEVIESYRKIGVTFEYFCCILPTVPNILPEKVAESYEILKKKKADGVMTVVEFGYPTQRMLKIDGGLVKMVDRRNVEKRSQDLEATYHDAGRFVWVKTESFLRQKTFFMKKLVPIVFDRLTAQDIDSLEDWKIAEIKYMLKVSPRKRKILRFVWRILSRLLALSSLAFLTESTII